MLFKLSLGNIRRSVRDYAVYFFTLLVGVAVFYVFNAIETQTAFMFVSSDTRRMINLLTGLLPGVSVFVALILGGLIVYASRFLMRRRNREFALYMVLGMSKVKVSAILLIETLMIGLVSLGAGLLLGVGLSQLMSAFTVSLFDADMTMFQFTFSYDAAVKTVLYFALIYVVTMLFNTVVVGRFRLINLMNSGRKPETRRLKSPAVCALVFIIGAVMLGFAYYKAVNDLDEIESDAELMLYVAMGAVSTFLIIWSVSGIITRLVTASKKLCHRGLNCFTFRQICSRINTMVISATIICLMLFVTICTLATAFSLKGSLSKNVDKYAPVDICVELYPGEAGVTETDIVKLYKSIGIDTDEYFSGQVQFTEYRPDDFTASEFFGEYAEDERLKTFNIRSSTMRETFMHLSAYNSLAELYGFEILELPADGYAVVSDHPDATKARNIVLEEGHPINVRGTVLRPAYSECSYGLDVISDTAINSGIIVVPDSLDLEAGRKVYFFAGNYKAQTKEEKRETDRIFTEALDELSGAASMRPSSSRSALPVVIMETRIRIVDSGVGLGAAATLLGLYVGIVFLISGGAILSIKMLSENIDSLPGYDILRRIGADEKDINRSLFRQTGVFFLLPLLLACIHSVFGMQFAMNVLAEFRVTGLLPAMTVTAVIIVAIYGGYFLITYLCGKNMIRNRS